MSHFPLRLPDGVMEQARRAAAEDGISIDQLFTALVSDGLGSRRDLAMLRARAARSDRPAALAILDRVPDVPPDAGDAFDDGLLPSPAERR